MAGASDKTLSSCWRASKVSRTRLLQALHSKDREAIKEARADAIKAGYSTEAVNAFGRVSLQQATGGRSAGHNAPGERPGVRAVYRAGPHEAAQADVPAVSQPTAPMSLANMRSLSPRSIDVTCCGCGY